MLTVDSVTTGAFLACKDVSNQERERTD